MRLSPIEGCNFGREVVDSPSSADESHRVDPLHEHGMLLFRNVRDISSKELAARVNAWFPTLEINEPSANRPADGDPMTVLGSTKDDQGRFNADYVPAATTSAPLLSGGCGLAPTSNRPRRARAFEVGGGYSRGMRVGNLLFIAGMLVSLRLAGPTGSCRRR